VGRDPSKKFSDTSKLVNAESVCTDDGIVDDSVLSLTLKMAKLDRLAMLDGR
jgi:hypothetical protein